MDPTPPELPIDVLLMIVETSARLDKRTAVSLTLVNKYIQAW